MRIDGLVNFTRVDFTDFFKTVSDLDKRIFAFVFALGFFSAVAIRYGYERLTSNAPKKAPSKKSISVKQVSKQPNTEYSISSKSSSSAFKPQPKPIVNRKGNSEKNSSGSSKKDPTNLPQTPVKPTVGQKLKATANKFFPQTQKKALNVYYFNVVKTEGEVPDSFMTSFAKQIEKWKKINVNFTKIETDTFIHENLKLIDCKNNIAAIQKKADEIWLFTNLQSRLQPQAIEKDIRSANVDTKKLRLFVTAASLTITQPFTAYFPDFHERCHIILSGATSPISNQGLLDKVKL